MQLQRDVGILSCVGGCGLEFDLVERQLFGAFAGDVFVVDRLPPEVQPRRRVHVVACRNAVEHIRLEHRIERHAAQLDVVAGENMGVVFQVMPDLAAVVIFEPGPELRQHLVARQLVRCPGVIVAERDIACIALGDGKREADNGGAHVIQAVRLGIEGDQVCLADLLQPGIERLPVEHGLVLDFLFLDGRCRRDACFLVELAQ